MKRFNFSKDIILTILRHTLGAIGAILVARFVGLDGFIEETSGGIMVLVSLVWSFWEKEGTLLEKVEGLYRHVIYIVLAFVTQFGKDPEGVGEIIGQVDSIVTIVIPLIFSLFSKSRRADARVITGYDTRAMERTFNG